ncbi:hypothetical protein FF38_03875 [Lucilia cuprina]|uniref:Uncharacterized protein n=1 Tax=Lucilia cuprina TaxID=7375 RepID=A0A0L0CGP6_LUCCU|nr:hypothetical protein FF38_03875 [Lucilia cuprina]
MVWAAGVGERIDWARLTRFLVSSSLGVKVSESELEDSPGVMRRMVPSLLTFNLGSLCKGTGGGGAGFKNSTSGTVGAGLVGDIVSVEFSNTGMEIIGRAVEPGFGGGKAGPGAVLGAIGTAGAFLVKVPFNLTSLGLRGGGGAALCGTCIELSCKATFGPVKLLVGEVASFRGLKVKPLNLPYKPPLPTLSFESLGDFNKAEFISSVLLGVDLGKPLACI